MNTGSEPSLRPVLPESFWTYLAFQLPSDQVDDLRAALNYPGQRFRGWYRQLVVCNGHAPRDHHRSAACIASRTTRPTP